MCGMSSVEDKKFKILNRVDYHMMRRKLKFSSQIPSPTFQIYIKKSIPIRSSSTYLYFHRIFFNLFCELRSERHIYLQWSTHKNSFSSCRIQWWNCKKWEKCIKTFTSVWTSNGFPAASSESCEWNWIYSENPIKVLSIVIFSLK
jgi:hypothetical protein